MTNHVLTVTIIGSEIESGIIISISDHFLVFTSMKTSLVQLNIRKTFIKHDINENSFKCFKSI